jgi:hypothetical protein
MRWVSPCKQRPLMRYRTFITGSKVVLGPYAGRRTLWKCALAINWQLVTYALKS